MEASSGFCTCSIFRAMASFRGLTSRDSSAWASDSFDSTLTGRTPVRMPQGRSRPVNSLSALYKSTDISRSCSLSGISPGTVRLME